MGRLPVRRNSWRKEEPKVKQDEREIEEVMFIPHTSDSDLPRLLQKTNDKVTSALKIPHTKYVEQAGTALKDLLIRKNPWHRLGGGCGRPSCHLCQSQGGNGTSCRREGTCYKIECSICDKEEGGQKVHYIGETRSLEQKN